jgi:hypothetical protein
MRALASVALPHADFADAAGVGAGDDRPSPHAPRSVVTAIAPTSARSRNAEVGMSVSVEMNDGRERASATAALMRQQCREDNYALLHASVVVKNRRTTDDR